MTVDSKLARCIDIDNVNKKERKTEKIRLEIFHVWKERAISIKTKAFGTMATLGKKGEKHSEISITKQTRTARCDSDR